MLPRLQDDQQRSLRWGAETDDIRSNAAASREWAVCGLFSRQSRAVRGNSRDAASTSPLRAREDVARQFHGPSVPHGPAEVASSWGQRTSENPLVARWFSASGCYQRLDQLMHTTLMAGGRQRPSPLGDWAGSTFCKMVGLTGHHSNPSRPLFETPAFAGRSGSLPSGARDDCSSSAASVSED